MSEPGARRLARPDAQAAAGVLDAGAAGTLGGGASFALHHRLFRLLWSVAWLMLAAWTPAALHRWRVALLNLFGADVAASAHVYPSARIWLPTNLVMRAHACLGPRARCYNIAPVTIEAGAIVSQDASLCTGTHDIRDPDFQLLAAPIVIRARAWIAAEAFVGPGVEVREGAVLGARGVAFQSLEAWTVYGGNPAVAVGQRVLRA